MKMVKSAKYMACQPKYRMRVVEDKRRKNVDEESRKEIKDRDLV